MMDIVISGQFLFYTAWNRQYVQKRHFLPKNTSFICYRILYVTFIWCFVHMSHYFTVTPLCRSLTKVEKTRGLKAPFMADNPELGRLDSLDIFADDFLDGT